MILRMPGSIPIDSNVDNFTINGKGEICFIDFAPPRVKGYEGLLLRNLFPNAFRGNSRLNGIARRLLKFEYHLYLV